MVLQASTKDNAKHFQNWIVIVTKSTMVL